MNDRAFHNCTFVSLDLQARLPDLDCLLGTPTQGAQRCGVSGQDGTRPAVVTAVASAIVEQRGGGNSMSHTSHIATTDDLARRLYRMARIQAGWSPIEFAGEAAVSGQEIEESLERLEELGLLRPCRQSPSGYRAVDPRRALDRLFHMELAQIDHYRRHVSSTHNAIRMLTEDFSGFDEDRRQAVRVEAIRDPAEVDAFLHDAIALLHGHEYLMYQGATPSVEIVDEMLLRDCHALGRGIQLKALHVRHIAEVDYVRDYLLDVRHRGAEVRLTDWVPLHLMVLDDALALIPIDPQDPLTGFLAVFSREVVRSYRAIFDFSWLAATPLDVTHAADETVGVGKLQLTPQELAIARMLATGTTNHAIARHLGVSARTLSRLITALLERLQVQTRFQAGMKIAQLDLLTTNGIPPAEGAAGRRSPGE
ncbi:helix-turn-helix transcriptional regulator [Nonomuraea diastatica]|nr:helix-turn-helix transcriptional regulator [Nonomuraea diastatica]